MAKVFSDSDPFFMAKQPHTESTQPSLELDPELRPLSLRNFPSEFPYEVDSPVESVLSSTETESSDEDDFFAGLTRRLAQFSIQDSPSHATQTQSPNLSVPRFTSNKTEKMWGVSESPNSTLSGIGSWSGGHDTLFTNPNPNPSPTYYGVSQLPSPPTTPFVSKYDAWDLICKAAGEVVRLKMTSEALEKKNYQNTPRHNVLAGNFALGQGHVTVPQNTTPTFSTGFSPAAPSNQQYLHVREDEMWKQHYTMLKMQQLQNRVRQNNAVGLENRPCGRGSNVVPQSAWTSLQMQHGGRNQTGVCNHKVRAVMPNGASTGVKRESTGTGVFLPRTRYGNPPETKKKSGCSTVLVPAKVVQALNLNIDDMNNNHSQPRLNNTFVTDHDALMARRNLVVAQQRGLNHEIRLPQEWTY